MTRSIRALAPAFAALWLLLPGTARADEDSEQEGERRSTGLMVTGIALTSTGVVGIAIGNLFALQALGQAGHGGGDKYAAGFAILGASSAAIYAGIPLWVVGAHRRDARSVGGSSTVVLGSRAASFVQRF